MPPATRNKSEQKRSYLIEQASRCLAERGYAGASLRDIARESGVSLGILHYYFANKEELLLAVIGRYKEQFLGRLEAELEAAAPDAEPIERLFGVLRQTLVEHADMHRLWYDLSVQALYQPAFLEPLTAIRERFIRFIQRAVDRWVPAAALHAAGYRPETLALLIYAVMDSLFFHALLARQAEPDEAFARFEQSAKEILFPLLGKTL